MHKNVGRHASSVHLGTYVWMFMKKTWEYNKSRKSIHTCLLKVWLLDTGYGISFQMCHISKTKRNTNNEINSRYSIK